VISVLVGLVFTAWMIWVPSVAPLSLDGDGEESDPRLATPTATVTSTSTSTGTGTGSDFPSAPASSSSSQMPNASPSQSHSRSRAHSSALSFEAVDEARYYGDDGGGGGEAIGVGGAVRVARPAASLLGAPAPASALNGFVAWRVWLLTLLLVLLPYCGNPYSFLYSIPTLHCVSPCVLFSPNERQTTGLSEHIRRYRVRSAARVGL
jgi:hypothetical protein